MILMSPLDIILDFQIVDSFAIKYCKKVENLDPCISKKFDFHLV